LCGDETDVTPHAGHARHEIDQTHRTMTDRRLSNSTRQALPASVAVPGYDRNRVVPGIIHLGVGAFHRAHQAAYVDDCLAAGDTDWGIVGVSLRSADTRDALAPQDGLYTLAVRSSDSESLRVVGSILSMLVAPEDPGAVLAALTDPRTAIVTLTITEKAYLRAAGGGLDTAHPDIVHDLANPQMPRTAHGFLAEALARRRVAGIQPFTVRRFARHRSRPPYRRRGGVSVEHGRSHRAGDHRCRPGTDITPTRRRRRLACHDRAVLPMGGRRRFPGGQAGLGKVRRHHGR
jgi:fructuronate reductase